MGTRIQPSHFPKKINQRVPLMQYSADVIHGAPHIANLGSPATLDADGLFDGVAAEDSVQTHLASAMKSTYSQANGLDANFGRNATMVGTAGSNHVATLWGRDYLGQPMKESFTLSGTTAQTGVKAFKWVDKLTIAVGAASDTVDVGWGDRLGLPYKLNRFIMGWEDLVEVGIDIGEYVIQDAAVAINGSSTSTYLAPFDGWYIGTTGIYTTAMTAAASVIDLIVDGTGIAAGDVTAPIGVVGAMFGNMMPVASWGAVNEGDSVAMLSGAQGTGGVADMDGHFARRKPCRVQAAGATSLTQLVTSDDPRGLFIPVTACDGSIVFKCEFIPDLENLHGNAHFFA